MTNEQVINILSKRTNLGYGIIIENDSPELVNEALEMVIIKLKQKDNKTIGYQECANALLKMWMDKILIDSEYNEIMNRLNERYKGIIND